MLQTVWRIAAATGSPNTRRICLRIVERTSSSLIPTFFMIWKLS